VKKYNERIIRIASELMVFSYKLNSNKFDITVESLEDKTVIDFKVYNATITEKKLKEIEDLLSSPRLHEIEEYYWNLSGNDIINTELDLVGMMVDESIVNYDKENHILYIKLIRLF